MQVLGALPNIDVYKPDSIEELICWKNNIKEFGFFNDKEKYQKKLCYINCDKFNNFETIEKNYNQIDFNFC